MSNTKNKFIVIIHKAPKGPLEVDEILALIEQGYVRFNDVAMCIPEEKTEKKSEWKFLWQFAEFDRRREKRPFEKENRERKKEEEIKSEMAELLPEEIDSLKPEDFTYHSTSNNEASFDDYEVAQVPTSSSNVSGVNNYKWVFFSFILIGVLYFVLPFESKKNDSSVAARIGSKQDGKVLTLPLEKNTDSKENIGTPLSHGSQTQTPKQQTAVAPIAPPKVEPPSPRDTGEISRADNERREEERLREADDKRFEDEDDSVDEETKPKKKKKRKIAAEEEEIDSKEVEPVFDEEDGPLPD